MEQVYSPNLLIIAIAGYCLKYIDDAGNAPIRTGTAKKAYNVELAAGRIRGDIIPEVVWLVGWLDFTKGKYTEEGHVFFIRRIGVDYTIYDSEVQSGARKPYKSIEELLAWFKVYAPVYIGWSTHCDGREYAKGKGDNMPTREVVIAYFNQWEGTNPTESEIQDYTNPNRSVEAAWRYLMDKLLESQKSRAIRNDKKNEARIRELESASPYEQVKQPVYVKKG